MTILSSTCLQTTNPYSQEISLGNKMLVNFKQKTLKTSKFITDSRDPFCFSTCGRAEKKPAFFFFFFQMALTGGIYLESPMSLSVNRFASPIPMCILCSQKICFIMNLGNTVVQEDWQHCRMAVLDFWLQAGYNCMNATMICNNQLNSFDEHLGFSFVFVLVLLFSWPQKSML